MYTRTQVKEFQEWLLGIPGIDEATALANVISYVESGEFDTIVFDTAPTGLFNLTLLMILFTKLSYQPEYPFIGHTLKLP
jgi:anion-transporting  ArsA/GET3 family ATPase